MARRCPKERRERSIEYCTTPGTQQRSRDLDQLARPERFELPTSWFVARRSIQLSYGRTCKTEYHQSRTSRVAMASTAWIVPFVRNLPCRRRWLGAAPFTARPIGPCADPGRSRAIGGEGGIRTLDGLLTHTPLAGARLRPLGHLSGRGRRPKSRSAG
jgi:hypothetical protein